MAVTDRRAARADLVETVERALAGGVTAVQLREKDLSARDLVALATALRERTTAHGALLLVNDRLDVALAAGADGVHLAGASLPPDAARRVVGDRLLLGVSTHTPDEARAAAAAGADYVVFGPVHRTPSKEGIFEPHGTDGLRRATEACPVPVVAIGGLDATTAAAAVGAGAVGVAVIRAILAAENPEAAAGAIRRALEARPARTGETR
jgi:thiamine-phosphate pyrophosphorylase